MALNTEQIDISTIPDGPEKEELLLQLKKEQAKQAKLLRQQECAAAQEEYNRRVSAVVETTLAYWRRGEMQQYDSTDLINASSKPGEVGIKRATNHVSPEDATFDSPSYFVCSTFAYNVYYEAIGYRLGGSERSCTCRCQMAISDASVVYHWMENYGETLHDAIKTLRPLLRPGDVLSSLKATGHCMVFLGDCFGDGTEYICHSWGGKYNWNTGEEAHESCGTVRLQPVDELCFHEGDKEWYTRTKTPRWSMYDDMREIILLRPLRVCSEETYPLTPNAKARLAHPGLNITRTASPGAYRAVAPGSLITYTVSVENHSKTDYSRLPVTEKLPQHTVLASDGGAEITADTLNWYADIPAGGSWTASYSVRVLPDAPGQILSTGGNVAGIRSNTIVTLVGKSLDDDACEKLARLTSDTLTALTGSSTAFANQLYRSCLRRNLSLPDAKTLVSGLVERFTGPGAEGPLVQFRKPAPDCEEAAKILVSRYWGGRQLCTEKSEDRILEFSLNYLQPGDILLYVHNPLEENQAAEVYVYLGSGAFAHSTDTGAKIVTGDPILWSAFQKDLFFCLRPSMQD